MTQKPAPVVKKQTIRGALSDLLLLLLMLCAAGFGGYFYGTHQKMAVVDLVPPGTPDAREMTAPAPTKSTASSTEKTPAPSGESTKETAVQTDDKSRDTPVTSTKKTGKLQYWLASTGDRMVGYSISATVNDTPVDNFFSPGKEVDVTDLVKKGANTVMFQAKPLEAKFNQHQGEKQFGLTVQLVRGPTRIQNFKPADVVAKYRRNAAETQEFSEEMDFTAE